MATHTYDYRKLVIPKLETGREQQDGSYRHHFIFQSTPVVAIGDNLLYYYRVERDEFWQIRGLRIKDATTPAGNGQGWQKQELGVLRPALSSPNALAADTIPEGPFTVSAQLANDIVWARGWDGVTYLTWYDAQQTYLRLTPDDPTWDEHLLYPGVGFYLWNAVAETAGAIARNFLVYLTVDRWRVPQEQIQRGKLRLGFREVATALVKQVYAKFVR